MSNRERIEELSEGLSLILKGEGTSDLLLPVEEGSRSQRLEIIDHHTSDGIARVREIYSGLEGHPENVLLSPFVQGEEQFLKHARFWEKTPIVEADIEEETSQLLTKVCTGIDKDKIKDIVGAGIIAKDLAFLTRETQKYRDDPALLEKNSRFIWDSAGNKLTLYLGPEEHRFMQKTRLLGLISFETIDKLRFTKFVSVGASVAASTLDLLVSLGAEDITFYDAGILDPADIAKSPAHMGGYKSVGQSKAGLLMQIMQNRNPYGNYSGVSGNVLLPSEEKRRKYDITVDEAISGADIVLEVVDSAKHKVGVRDYMKMHMPNTPLVYIADTGSSPFAGIEIPGKGNYFNQFLTDQEEIDLRVRANSSSGALGAIYKMVEKDLPSDHELQLLYIALGKVPYLSQTPASARASSEIAVKLILLHLQGKEIAGSNFHSYDSPTSLIDGFDEENAATLKAIMERILLTPLE